MARLTKPLRPDEPISSPTEAASEQPQAPAAQAAAPEQVSVDEQLARLPAWEQAALRAEYRWPQGLRLSTAEFAEAREAVKAQVIK